MLTIAWDVDDVLNDLMRTWFEAEWLTRYPLCEISYNDISENPPHGLLGVSREEYLCSLDRFRQSDAYLAMEPVGPVMEWFRSYGERFRHIAVTAVPRTAAHRSAQWVVGRFGDWIRTFHFVPSARPGATIPAYDRGKGEFLRWLGRADVFIDDDEGNIASADGLDVRCLLFPRPWNGAAGKTIEEALDGLSRMLMDK
ncbi:MAG TPA: hypothetical protein PLG31_12080 [Spirochaetota bacterium]|nr:hypothetical protein [Spirochaetota bacterium]